MPDESAPADTIPSKERRDDGRKIDCNDGHRNAAVWGKSDDTLYEMVERLKEVIYATDENGVVTYVSPNIEAVSGYRRDEVLGQSFFEFVSQEDLLNRTAQFLKVLNGESRASEYRLQKKDHQLVWVRTEAQQIIKNGRVVGVQGVLVDITERKIAEKALRESEEKYRILVENAKDAVFVTQDGVVKFMNPIAAGFLGHDPEVVEKTPFLEFIHPDDRQMIRERYERRIRGEPVSDAVMFRVINKEGVEKSVDLNAVLIDWDGRPAVLNFMRDITPQKELEAQLQQAQRLEAIGTLAGGIAHNFNNLLMGIQGNALQLLRQLEPSLPGRERALKIIDLVKSGSKLTTQLLGYARGGRYDVRAVNLNGLLETVIDTVAAMRKEVTIQRRLAPDLPEIEAEQGQIEQVVYNLLINAADAMPRGGSIFVETGRAPADPLNDGARQLPAGDYVRLTVTDTGAGMDTETKKRIFDPFFTTKPMGAGTGLGLASVYGIIKAHGGAIRVDSSPGKGATFTVFLPACAAKEEVAPSPASEHSAGEKVVLVVDDEPFVLEVTVELLEALGFDALACGSGSEAIRIFEEHRGRIDLVLLDLTMPDMGGGETFDRLRRIDDKVKVLLCSGYGQDSQAEEILNRGCNGFIQKPYNLESLASKISQIASD
jgi:PAS domain S-box-containing protein